MKKSIFLLIASAALFLAAACTQDIDSFPEEEMSVGKDIVYITASIDQSTKATIDGTTGALSFTQTSDKIIVFNGTAAYVGTATADGNPASFAMESGFTESNGIAAFPSGMVTSINATDVTFTLPSSYDLADVSGDNTPCPLVATYTAGNAVVFKQLCGLLRLTVSAIPAGTDYLKLDFDGKKVNGAFALAGVNPGTTSICTADVNDASDVITVTGITNETSVTINIPMPASSNENKYRDITVSAWAVNGEDPVVPLMAQVIPFGENYNVQTGHGQKIAASLNLVIFSAAAGKFVVFAPGNLQYIGNSGSVDPYWRFAANQYDYIGQDQAGSDEGVNRDLFGWGTSGYDYTADASYPDGSWINFMPYSLSIDSETDNYGYGPSIYNGNGSNLTGNYAKGDWGYNLISSGAGTFASATWRTPTGGENGEWDYIFGARTSLLPLGKWAKVGNVHGYLLMPDNSLETLEGSYSVDQWNTLQAEGAVFLPAAGGRSDDELYNVNSWGGYWSSTAESKDSAYMMAFSSEGLNPYNYEQRFIGLSVRLIREID